MATPAFQFEFFPPQTLDASFRLWETVQTLAPLDPAFVSVTYGAGGTTRKLTHEAVEAIDAELRPQCRRPPDLRRRDQGRDARDRQCLCRGRRDRRSSRCAATRPRGADSSSRIPQGFANSVELIEALAATGKFNLRVGAYPDVTPRPPTNRRHPLAEGQARRRRHVRHHPVLLRGRNLPALPRRLREGRHHPEDHPRHPADPFLDGRAPLRRTLRRPCAAAARRGVPERRARRARGTAGADPVHHDVRPADHRRGRGSALLHAQPPEPDPRGGACAGPCPGTGAGKRGLRLLSACQRRPGAGACRARRLFRSAPVDARPCPAQADAMISAHITAAYHYRS